MLLKWIFKNKKIIQHLNLKNVEPTKYHNMCLGHLQLSYEMFIQWHFLGCSYLWHLTIDALLQKTNQEYMIFLFELIICSNAPCLQFHISLIFTNVTNLMTQHL